MFAGLSLANLAYFRIWSALLTYTSRDEFTMKAAPGREYYLATMLNVVVAGCLLALLMAWIARRWPRRRPGVAEWLLLVCIVLTANGVRAVLSQRLEWMGGGLFRVLGEAGVNLLLASLATAAGLIYFLAHRAVIRLVFALCMILAPALAVTFTQGVIRIAAWREFEPDKPLAEALPTPPPGTPRLVWVVFDELDYGMSFERRMGGIRLPEFDRLRREALSASHAVSPSTATMYSLTAQTTGRRVSLISFLDASRAAVKFTEGRRALLGDQPNVFSLVRERGGNTAIAGWYLPYSRIYADEVVRCVWTPFENQTDPIGRNLIEMAASQSRSLVETSLLSPFGASLTVSERRENLQKLLAEAREIVRDSSIRLAFLHLPVPHAPHLFDRRSRRLTLVNSPVQGYLGAQELSDLILGEIRHNIELGPRADDTILLVSSDHAYRSARLFGAVQDNRVPFLVKFPGKSRGLAYDRPFDTLLTGELVIALLDSQLRGVEDVARWLDTRSKP